MTSELRATLTSHDVRSIFPVKGSDAASRPSTYNRSAVPSYVPVTRCHRSYQSAGTGARTVRHVPLWTKNSRVFSSDIFSAYAWSPLLTMVKSPVHGRAGFTHASSVTDVPVRSRRRS